MLVLYLVVSSLGSQSFKILLYEILNVFPTCLITLSIEVKTVVFKVTSTAKEPRDVYV